MTELGFPFIDTLSMTSGYVVLAKFTIEVEYTIPVPVLGKLAEHLIVKRDARTLEMALTNVQETLER